MTNTTAPAPTATTNDEPDFDLPPIPELPERLHGVLWGSNGGRVACSQHLGYAANTDLRFYPAARRIETSLDVWYRVSAAEKDEYLAMLGTPMACETCGAQDR